MIPSPGGVPGDRIKSLSIKDGQVDILAGEPVKIIGVPLLDLNLRRKFSLSRRRFLEESLCKEPLSAAPLLLPVWRVLRGLLSSLLFSGPGRNLI